MGFGEHCPFLGGWSLSLPASPCLAGPGCQSGAGAEEAEDISCLADCAGLINVPECEGTQESASGPWLPGAAPWACQLGCVRGQWAACPAVCVGVPPALWASLGRGSQLLEKLVLWVGKTEMLPVAWSQTWRPPQRRCL